MRSTTNLRSWAAIPIFLAATAALIACGKTIYVDADANGLNNGSSWANAYNYLQGALADANSSAVPVEIRVAQGMYRPDESNGVASGDRTATFQLISGVNLKGGYAGFGEPDPNARDIESYETILTGDLAGNDVDVNDPCDLLDEPARAENSYHVLTGSGTDETAVLDGFTITAGNAKGSGWAAARGGGIYSDRGDPILTKCTFVANSAQEAGGAIYDNGTWSPSLLDYCRFTRNAANGDGGAVYFVRCLAKVMDSVLVGNYAGSTGGAIGFADGGGGELVRCIIKNNTANIHGGAVSAGYYSFLRFANCVMTNNTAVEDGGGVYLLDSRAELQNCTISGNSAETGKGGGVHCKGSGVEISNSILWSDAAVTGPEIAMNGTAQHAPTTVEVAHSDAEGGQGMVYQEGAYATLVWGPGNIDVDPCFVGPDHADYHLKSEAGRWHPGTQTWVRDGVTSLCIDAGNPLSPIGLEPFPNGGRINMGAYGGTVEASKSYFGEPLCDTVVAGDINGDCKVDFVDFRFIASCWLQDTKQ